MVNINSRINDREVFLRKNSLNALQTVMSKFKNIRGIAVTSAEYHGLVEDGIIISIEVDVNELDSNERNTLKELGLTVPFINRLGDEIKIERINFDKKDIKKLEKL